VSTATCDIRFSLQDRYASARLVDALTSLGVSNRAVTISGRATRSEKEISRTDFVDARVDEIRARLTKYLENHERPRADDLVILDMEPRGIAPRHLGGFEHDTKLQRELIAAYRRRIRVARSELRRTKLGLYQVIVPDAKGRHSPEFRQRLRGYVAAGEQGMYDQLDFLCPVLYQRFAADDAKPETLRKWLAASTRQAVRESAALTRKNGAPIPLAPILSLWVFNERPADDPVRPAVAPASIARQLGIVQAAEGVGAIVFWSGWQTAREMRSAAKPVEPIDIADFLRSVGSLPWPGCA
jgi:hypothetical protein